MRRLPAGPAANEASTLGSAPRCPDLWRETGQTAARVSPLPSGPAARPLSRVVTCSTVSVPKNTVSAHGFGWGVRDGHEQRWRPAVTAATSRPMRTTGGARRAGDCRRGCLPGRSGRRLGRRASWPTQSMNLGRGIEGTCGGDRSFSSLFFFCSPCHGRQPGMNQCRGSQPTGLRARRHRRRCNLLWATAAGAAALGRRRHVLLLLPLSLMPPRARSALPAPSRPAASVSHASVVPTCGDVSSRCAFPSHPSFHERLPTT